MNKLAARWLVVVGLVLLGVVAAGAGEVQAVDVDPWGGEPRLDRRVDRARQIFNDDLTVENGQVIDEDVTVMSGDVEINEGGRINGNLLVMSGDIEIAEAAAVTGDVTTYSGNVKIAGEVGGSVASMSGNIRLADTAVVQGDVSVVSGNLSREDGAVVRGNIAEGPNFRFGGRAAPDAPAAPQAPNAIHFERPGRSFVGGILAFFGRILAAVVMTVLATLIVVGLYYVRPQIITDTRTILRHQTALSAVVGVLVNLTLLFLGGVLAVTICLLPLALVAFLALLALNAVGWAVASQIVGERLVQWAKQPVQESLKIGVGAVVLTGFVTLLWALGGCFGPLAFLVTLAIGSLGTGAFLLPWINRRRDDGTAPTTGGETPEPIDPSGGTGGTGSAVPSVYTPGTTPAQPVETDVAAPIDYVTAEEVNEGVQPQHPVTPERADTPLSEDATEGEETLDLDAAAPLDYRTAQEINAEAEAAGGDDFTRIRGIGPAYARRLKQAGLTSFARLTATIPAQIAEILGWPEARVIRDELVDQARVLAERG